MPVLLAIQSGMQVAGKQSTTSRQEMYRRIIKKPSKHALAQASVKTVRANTSHCVSAAFDRALIGNFYSALTLLSSLCLHEVLLGMVN